MAAKLVNFYTLMAKDYGVTGRMKLAMLTQISSDMAQTAEDSPDNIRKFEEVTKQILQQPAK